ncbi:hypothetical protein EMCRGX_G003583 [Ephydatia muelleri]
MERAIESACKRLGYSKLKEEQLRSVVDVLSGRDAFVSFPTGYGKSLCYAILPWAFDEYGQDALMATIDLKAAFRLIPVQAADWVHLGICWRGQFYVDACLPFGLRSAPALFNHYAEALDWIMANNYGAQLLHYLDDFLLVGPPGKDTCQEAMSRMLTVCDQLGIPVASEKLEGPTTALTFLGIVLDTSAQQLRLPLDKLEELTGLIRSWLSRHKATKRELLSLIGKLSFAAKLGNFTFTSALMQKQEPTLEWTAADSLQLYTDASGYLGFGAYFNGAWFRGGPSTNPNPTSPARDLNHHLQLLLNRAMAPSTATTYATGIRCYQGFCHAFKLIPVPGTKETITLFAAHLSRTLNSRTIQIYVAVSLIPAPLREPHDRRMLRAALTLGFFGFLRVSEFTLKNRGLTLRYHPTRQDISWTGCKRIEGMHFFIKRSKTDQMGKGTTICIGRTEGRHTCPVAAMEAYRGCCRCPIQSSPLFHFRDGRPLTSKSFRSTFLSLVEQCGYNPAQCNTHSLRIGAATAAARAGLPTETIQKLGRWRSSAYQTYTRHPLTHPSDTRTMAAQRDLIATSGIPSKARRYYIKAKARARYKADPEKKKAPVRDSYKADPEKKKASVRDSYNADIESKQSAKRQRYQEDLEENRAAKRQRYQEDVEENRAAKGRNARTIQLPLRHLKGIGIGMTPLSDWLNVLPRESGIAGVTELPLPPKDLCSAAPLLSASSAAPTASSSRAASPPPAAELPSPPPAAELPSPPQAAELPSPPPATELPSPPPAAELPSPPPAAELPSPPPAAELPSPPPAAELPSPPPAAELPSPPPAVELPSPPPAAELPSLPPAAELPSPPPAATPPAAAAAGAPLQYWHQCPHHHFACCHHHPHGSLGLNQDAEDTTQDIGDGTTRK